MFLALMTFVFAVVDTRILAQYGAEQASGSFIGDVVVSVASVLVMTVAVLGIIGVVKSSIKIIYLYVGFLMLLTVLEVLIGIYVSIQRYGLQFRVGEWIREEFYRNVTGASKEAHRKLWERIQINYQCCGLNGPQDYTAMDQPISLSCCYQAYQASTLEAEQKMYKTCIETSSYFREGCEDEILGILAADADYLLGVAVISFWFEAVGMLLAMWVANQLKNSVRVYKHTVKY
ncbi:23 kDa integral membrane protein-like isoform X1 [Bombyx mori]|uniref:23 kDa integral membrane protein-like isoform X1 n=2 Tax=Bombyx mori TaxID=7091 RepID=UPI000640A905